MGCKFVFVCLNIHKHYMVFPGTSHTHEECIHNNKCSKLCKLCEYYKINITDKSDLCELTRLVRDYENNPENTETVARRRVLWDYMKELQNDDYTRRFIFFDVYFDDIY